MKEKPIKEETVFLWNEFSVYARSNSFIFYFVYLLKLDNKTGESS